jgi:hypothetical protein
MQEYNKKKNQKMKKASIVCQRSKEVTPLKKKKKKKGHSIRSTRSRIFLGTLQCEYKALSKKVIMLYLLCKELIWLYHQHKPQFFLYIHEF